MSNPYTRQQESNITDGNVIEAIHLNDELNALASAFSGTDGHSHNGGSGQGTPLDITTATSGDLPLTRTSGTLPLTSTTGSLDLVTRTTGILPENRSATELARKDNNETISGNWSVSGNWTLSGTTTLSGTPTLGAPLNANSQKITNLAAPTAAGDAVNKASQDFDVVNAGFLGYDIAQKKFPVSYTTTRLRSGAPFGGFEPCFVGIGFKGNGGSEVAGPCVQLRHSDNSVSSITAVANIGKYRDQLVIGQQSYFDNTYRDQWVIDGTQAHIAPLGSYNNSANVGVPTARIGRVYAAFTADVASDRTLKRDVTKIDGLKAWNFVKYLRDSNEGFVFYKSIQEFSELGSSAKQHVGNIAQIITDAITSAGLPNDLGIVSTDSTGVHGVAYTELQTLINAGFAYKLGTL